MGDFLIYGATGYTGRLIAEHAVERGLTPVLAGRRAEAVRSLAKCLGLRPRVFGLESRTALKQGLDGMTAVLHAAGPFSATSAPMAEACLAAGVHYCDITGEIDVFEDLLRRDTQAKAVSVMLMPGVGFDVVPSDCLAAHVLGLSFDAIGGQMPRRFTWGDDLSAILSKSDGVVHYLAFARSAADPFFDDADIEMLKLLAPHVPPRY